MNESFDQFQGTNDYILSPELRDAVNVAIAIRRPLLIKGEPGTGKTMLAKTISDGLGLTLFKWQVKSTSKAMDGLYVYDTVQRLNDSRFGDRDVSNIRNYIRFGPLGQAFMSEKQSVVLIDEIDKADLEFPNDLLAELDEMAFVITETSERIVARQRPIVLITSNSEKELPAPFLRRCIFHYIEFPGQELMEKIVRVHFPKLKDSLLNQCLARFFHLRSLDQLRKKPSTSELIDWVGVLLKAGVTESELKKEIPFLGALLKNEQDLLGVEAALSRKPSPQRSW